MSVLYEILVATAFSLLLSPAPEVENQDLENDKMEQVSLPEDNRENASEASDCNNENPE